MRPHALSFALVALAFTAAPAAFAQDAPITFISGTGSVNSYTPTAESVGDTDATQEMTEMAARLADPATQDSIAGMVEKMSATMLQLPVGKFVAAIEDARPGTVKKRVRDDATLADLAGPKADAVPEMLGQESRTAMRMASGFAKAFAVMLPEFEALGKEMEKEFKAAKSRR